LVTVLDFKQSLSYIVLPECSIFSVRKLEQAIFVVHEVKPDHKSLPLSLSRNRSQIDRKNHIQNLKRSPEDLGVHSTGKVFSDSEGQSLLSFVLPRRYEKVVFQFYGIPSTGF
jgi:hypothetical protein